MRIPTELIADARRTHHEYYKYLNELRTIYYYQDKIQERRNKGDYYAILPDGKCLQTFEEATANLEKRLKALEEKYPQFKYKGEPK